MKISCQSCAAKYTIADEKVVGKVIKIKCKKCSSTIVVNGNDPSVLAQLGDNGLGEDQATQLASRPPEPLAPNPDEWTVSVTDDDQRTMTTAQILAEYGAGGLSSDTYVWRDGMGDWQPLHQVPELMPLLAATGSAPADPYAPPMGYHAGGMGDMASPAPMAAAAMPFGNGSAASNAAKRASRASVDLFGGGGLQEEVARPNMGMPPPGISDRHVGERNETSVLFSLKDLAAAESAMSTGAPKRGPFAESERIEDLLSLGSGSAAPMLAPPPMNTPFIEPPPPPPPSVVPVAAATYASAYQPPPPKKSPMPLVLAGVGVAALLGAVALFLMSGKDEPEKTTSTTPSTTEKASEPAKTKDTSGNTTSKPVDTSTTATPDPTTSTTTDPDPKATTTTTTTTKVALVDPTSTTKKEDPKVEPPKEDPKPDPGSGGGGDAPFDRGAASAAMNGAAGSAKGCKKADGPTGSAKVQVTFAPSGKATQATVGAPFAGTSVGSCIAGAFRGLSVPKFSGAAVTVGKTVNIK